MEKYFVGLDLSRWAIIQYSSHLWKRPDLKRHLTKASVQCNFDEENVIPPSLHDELNKLILPLRRKNELKFAIGSMGSRIRTWLGKFPQGINEETWPDFVDYLDHIHWTYLGCIDLTQTTKSLYKSGLLPMNYHTWLWLCEHCVEECIVDFWKKISHCNKHANQVRREIAHSRNDNDYFTDIYWRLRMEDKLDEFEEEIYFYEVIAVDEFISEKSHQEHHRTFIYFWNRLNDVQKRSMLNKIIACYGDGADGWFETFLNQDIDYFMFMIKQYLFYEFEEVIVDIFQSSSIAVEMLNWPCENNFIPALKASCNNGSNWGTIVGRIIDFMGLERAYIGDDSRARIWLYQLWNCKDTYEVDEDVIMGAVEDMNAYKDVALLKYIVTHAKSVEEKEKLLEFIVDYNGFYELEFLKKFVQEVSQEIHVREWLQRKLAEEKIVIEGLWEN